MIHKKSYLKVLYSSKFGKCISLYKRHIIYLFIKYKSSDSKIINNIHHKMYSTSNTKTYWFAIKITSKKLFYVKPVNTFIAKFLLGSFKINTKLPFFIIKLHVYAWQIFVMKMMSVFKHCDVNFSLNIFVKRKTKVRFGLQN